MRRHLIRLMMLMCVGACGPRTAAPVDRGPAVAPDAGSGSLAAAPPPDAAPDECLAAADHVLDVLVAEADPAGTSGARERLEESRAALVAECHEYWTATQIGCVRNAASYERISRCFTL